MRRWELKTTLMIRIFDVSCDEDTGEMKQGDNAMRCLSCHWIYIWAPSPFSPHWESHYQSYTQCSNNTVLFVSGDIIENMLTKALGHSFAIDPLKRTLDSIASTKQQTLIRKMMELSCLVLFWSVWENAIIVSSSVSSSCCEMWQKIIPLEWLFQRHVCIRKLGTNNLFIVVLSFFLQGKGQVRFDITKYVWNFDQ